MISVRTLGTSAKKKRAKTPATTPNEPAVMPLRIQTLAATLTPIDPLNEAFVTIERSLWVQAYNFNARPGPMP